MDNQALAPIAVVVPAHNEQARLVSCLRALARAARWVGNDVVTVVVADACDDATAAIARRHAAVVVVCPARNVGVARDRGVQEAVRLGARWIATTDADSVVPPGWLAGQAALAASGAEVVVGTVSVRDWRRWPAWLKARYEAEYSRTHPHVHGANLGFSATAYQQAGGFPPSRRAEDVGLVNAALRAGLAVRYTARLPVVTSARRRSRVVGGFASYLARFAEVGPSFSTSTGKGPVEV